MVVVNRKIDDAMIEENRKLIGKKLDRRHQRWNTVANADAIRQWVWGIGDDNPLWLDQEYAKQSVLGVLSAPGTFLHSIDSGAVFPGLEGLARLLGKVELEWYERIQVGDSFTSESEYLDVVDVVGEKAGRMLIQIGDTIYWNQRGAMVGKKRNHSIRIVRRAGGGKLDYEPRVQDYTVEDLQAIQREVLAERRTGADQIYWEDVSAGDTMGPMVKGPLSETDLICWYCGNGPHGRRPHRLFWKEVEANPDFYYTRADTGALEFSERGHYSMEMARELGMPGPYDNGSQRPCWMGHFVTDWMGDGGFMSKLSVRMRLPNVFGDTQWIRGKVAGTRELSAHEGTVDIDIEATNQLGELTTTGSAEVFLPRRDGAHAVAGPQPN